MDGIEIGYLPGAVFRAPGGANNAQKKAGHVRKWRSANDCPLGHIALY